MSSLGSPWDPRGTALPLPDPLALGRRDRQSEFRLTLRLSLSAGWPGERPARWRHSLAPETSQTSPDLLGAAGPCQLLKDAPATLAPGGPVSRKLRRQRPARAQAPPT